MAGKGAFLFHRHQREKTIRRSEDSGAASADRFDVYTMRAFDTLWTGKICAQEFKLAAIQCMAMQFRSFKRNLSGGCKAKSRAGLQWCPCYLQTLS